MGERTSKPEGYIFGEVQDTCGWVSAVKFLYGLWSIMSVLEGGDLGNSPDEGSWP